MKESDHVQIYREAKDKLRWCFHAPPLGGSSDLRLLSSGSICASIQRKSCSRNYKWSRSSYRQSLLKKYFPTADFMEIKSLPPLPPPLVFFFFQWRTTFIQVRAPFAGHPAASSAWLPAAKPSPPGGLGSHCNRERGIDISSRWHLQQMQFKMQTTTNGEVQLF